MTPRLKRHFEDYESVHKTRGNVICHEIGLPLLIFSILGLLSRIEIFPAWGFDFGLLLVLICALWLIYTDWKVMPSFIFTIIGFYLIARMMENSWLYWAFGLGWVFQLFGHAFFEKKNPAFFRSVKHVFVGPLWLFAKLTGYLETRVVEGPQRDPEIILAQKTALKTDEI